MNNCKIGIIGAGRLGTALARAFAKTIYEVSICNAQDKASLALQTQILMPTVTARNTAELVAWADVIILAVPLPRYRELPLNMMAGKIVIDAMNYWAPADGKLPEFDAYVGSSSELVATSIPGARIVKTLNSVAYGEIEEYDPTHNNSVRRAIAIAGDDHDAKQVVIELVSSIGFDPVDLGDLKQGIRFQPDTKLFNARLTRSEMLAIKG